MSDVWEGLRTLAVTFDFLGVDYFVTGSLASSAYGAFRYANDLDIVAELELALVDEIAGALQPEFYADAQAMRSAVANKRPFTVIHLDGAFKFDVFPLPYDDFHQSCMRRRCWIDIVQTASVEDVILSKLDWYKMGGGLSDQKWRDLLGVMKMQGENVDREYLRHWARVLHVEDLLYELMPS